jgi:hypothetical protein
MGPPNSNGGWEGACITTAYRWVIDDHSIFQKQVFKDAPCDFLSDESPFIGLGVRVIYTGLETKIYNIIQLLMYCPDDLIAG